MAPKPDVFAPANEPNPDEAKAEAEVCGCCSVFEDAEDPRLANGDDAEVFANPEDAGTLLSLELAELPF